MILEEIDYRQKTIESYEVMTKNMAIIIGHYEGYVQVLAAAAELLSKKNGLDEDTKSELEWMVNRTRNLITETEELWNTRMIKKD